ncbi:MAG: 4'-phosphopantetheinyl transferase [Flavobacteriales bacterium]|jgi:4'-phosphopantetheinyl transferase|tara:strand:+ start:189 stop:770 length:582 start_codon:yes stop_codon:yes gene_type:complete
MPIIHKIEKKNVTILVWEITETLEELQVLGKEINATSHTSEKRKKEYLASRLLINEIIPNTAITYNEFGAPELENDNHISISHSRGLVSIIISKQQVGIDIEEVSEKTLRLALKFVSAKNLTHLTKEKATLIWCIKEAAFKWHQKGGVDFIKDIIIPEFSVKEKGIITIQFKNKELNLNYQKINNHYLVYVCN